MQKHDRTARDRHRPHVAIIVVNLPVERDRRVIRECLALEAAGYRVTVICPRGNPRVTTVPGTRDTTIRSFRQPFAGQGVASFALEFAWAFAAVAYHLTGLVLRQRVVAAQACNPPDVFWPLALIMRALGKKWIFDHHDLSPELYRCKAARPNRLALRVLTWFERRSLRAANAVVSTNESYREVALRRGGCDPERVSIVRNAPSAAELRSAGRTANAGGVEADEQRKRIVYVGVINEQDNVDRAVLAAQRLAGLRNRSGWEMIIAGDGECLDDLKRIVDEQGIGDVVTFAGWLESGEVDRLLRSATLGIQPDARNDMTNLSTMAKTVEYMARGLPVVAVDLLETRRTAGDAGRYVPNGTPDEFAKAIDDLLDDEAALAKMGAIARERFTSILAWEHQVESYIRTWNSLVPALPSKQRRVPSRLS
jgi:glycosyltransferase involved in cell wall biosynthesis